jgi:acyl carrier protein
MTSAIDLVSKVLKIDKYKIKKNSKSENFDEWDSLASIRIFLAIEKIIKKKLDHAYISKLNSIEEIDKIIKEK